MIIKIKKITPKTFKGDDGEDHPYFWYVAEKEDGSAIRFGSSDGERKIGDTVDAMLEERQQSNGGKGWFEIL